MLYIMKGFSVQKEGSKEEENEDAFTCKRKNNYLAIADGATESSYSKEWAKLLVHAFSCSARIKEFLHNKDGFRRIIECYQRKWHDQVPWSKLKWLFEAKAKQGAFATFLGIKFINNYWEAIGIGDCNLFIIDENGFMKQSIPARSSKEFGTSPFLIPSIPGKVLEKALSALWYDKGALETSDWIIAATDAVAAYLLYKHETNMSQFMRVRHIDSKEKYFSWVKECRKDGMRNDDATLVVAYKNIAE